MCSERTTKAFIAACDLHGLVLDVVLWLSYALFILQASLRGLEVFKTVVRLRTQRTVFLISFS